MPQLSRAIEIVRTIVSIGIGLWLFIGGSILIINHYARQEGWVLDARALPVLVVSGLILIAIHVATSWYLNKHSR